LSINEKKSQTNKQKYGIDFLDAQKLWQDENALIVPANIVDNGTRYALISKNKTITAKEFDEKFDNGEDISEYLDFSKATRLNVLNTNTKKVNVDFPEWIIEALDKEAKKIGVTRQSIIKVWIAERLKEEVGHL